jgi:myo-inositol-1(or 4)-monophosphatase
LPDPAYLATAVEIVLKAGDIQHAGQESGFRIDKKGSIDLVTEIDLACERMCREILAERFPDHDVLAEELGGSAGDRPPSRFRWVFDPLDGTTNYARPSHLPPSFALEIDGRLGGGHLIRRKRLFTAEA